MNRFSLLSEMNITDCVGHRALVLCSLTRNCKKLVGLRDVRRRRLCSANVSETSKRFADTLHLPVMPYALSVYKADGKCNDREKYVREATGFDKLYDWQQKNNRGTEFIIHDGPPYANGNPHAGHALNKIIKDVINRYRVLRGHRVTFVPGWDCHGLPIELKARTANDSHLSDIDVRKLAHSFSQEAVKLQKAEFQLWGIIGDWGNPYVTSTADYISRELHVFQQMHEKGLIYQDYMPVFWSPSSLTALAEAELEYVDHISTALYAKFKITHTCEEIKSYVKDVGRLYLLIWTTTPWTLPANQAVCFSPSSNYSLVKDSLSGTHYIIATDLIDQVSKGINVDLEIQANFSGESLNGTTYEHPVYEELLCPVLPASHVTVDVGTGLVHTAPAHGLDDYKVGLKHNLAKRCFVDGKGCYTSDAGVQLEGKHVLNEGNDLVIKILGPKVVSKSPYKHKYPYDWRTKQPIITRASSQWFIDTKSLIRPALAALEKVDVFPEVYKSALAETISQRSYWCISRQRAWGVPIPYFTDSDGKPVVHRAITNHICRLIEEHGSNIWWTADNATILPSSIKEQAKLDVSKEYSKGRDILDIWFDSGVSWAAVLSNQQADLYVEGVDQIRGWFQSSLLTSVAITGQAPYKTVMIHGFAVDEDGQKMSKSIGNVVMPSQVVYGKTNDKKWPAYGIDLLRWWAANKYSITNVDIGPAILKQYNEQLLLLRKRMRFILGNLFDFHPSDNLIDYEEMLPQDQYFLHLLFEFGTRVTLLYDRNEMSSVLNELQLFTTKFSNFYSTISKDRLYCFPSNSLERRSAQTVLHHTLHVLCKSFAPILPFFSEDCYFYRHNNQLNLTSHEENTVFRSGWFSMDDRWQNIELSKSLEDVLLILEEIRIKIPTNASIDQMEIQIHVKENSQLHHTLQMLQGEDTGLCTHSPLCELLQAAGVSVVVASPETLSNQMSNTKIGNCYVEVKKTSMTRCQRCRRYTATDSQAVCQPCLDNMASTWTD